MAQSTKRTFKTKKVLSGVRSEYRGWKEWDEEDTLIFKFLGTSPNKMNRDKNNYLVEVIETFFADKKEMKRLPAGARLTLNSAGQFDKGMEQVEEGAIVQVVYKGCNEMEGGKFAGKEAHNMEVTELEEEGDESEDEDQDDSHEAEDSEDDDL